MIKLIFFSLTICLCSFSLAKRAATVEEMIDSVKNQGASRRTPLINYGVYGLYGTGEVQDQMTQETLNYNSVGFLLGKSVSLFKLSLNFEYQKANQVEQSLYNYSGSSLNSGVRLDVTFAKKNTVGIVYKLLDNYELTTLDSLGNVVKYKNNSGFSVQYLRKVFGNFGFLVDYSSQKYLNETSNNQMSQSRMSLGLAYSN